MADKPHENVASFKCSDEEYRLIRMAAANANMRIRPWLKAVCLNEAKRPIGKVANETHT